VKHFSMRGSAPPAPVPHQHRSAPPWFSPLLPASRRTRAAGGTRFCYAPNRGPLTIATFLTLLPRWGGGGGPLLRPSRCFEPAPPSFRWRQATHVMKRPPSGSSLGRPCGRTARPSRARFRSRWAQMPAPSWSIDDPPRRSKRAIVYGTDRDNRVGDAVSNACCGDRRPVIRR